MDARVAAVDLANPANYPSVEEFEREYDDSVPIAVVKDFAVSAVVLAALRYESEPSEALYNIVCKRLTLKGGLLGTTVRFHILGMYVDLQGNSHQVSVSDGDMVVDVGGRQHSLREYKERVQRAHDLATSARRDQDAAAAPFLGALKEQVANFGAVDFDGLVAQELAELRGQTASVGLDALTQIAYFDLLNEELRRVTGTGPFAAKAGEVVTVRPDGSVPGLQFNVAPKPNTALTVESAVDRVRGRVVLVDQEGRAYQATNETVLYM